jgi:hypothetical protein
MDKNIFEFIRTRIDDLKELISNNKEGKILDLVLSKINKRLFLEIREKKHRVDKSKIILFSRIYTIIEMDNKIGIIRDSYDYSLYEWLQRNPDNREVELIMSQINRINSILKGRKLSKLEDIWIKKVNKGFPVIINGNIFKHNGYLIGITNLGRKKINRDRLNKEIRLKNLMRLYSKDELERMYMINDKNILNTLIENNEDKDLILRRLDCSKIARLI